MRRRHLPSLRRRGSARCSRNRWRTQGGYSDFRVIPTDHRPFDKNALRQTKYTGHSVGHWDGDTLVIESIGFVPETWLSRGGFFHSEQLHVVEKFTRVGNEIKFEVTVEDPQVLAEPWVMTPRILRLVTNPDAGLIRERGNCETDFERGAAATQIRH